MKLCRYGRLDEARFVRFRQLVEDEEVDVNCTNNDNCTKYHALVHCVEIRASYLQRCKKLRNMS